MDVLKSEIINGKSIEFMKDSAGDIIYKTKYGWFNSGQNNKKDALRYVRFELNGKINPLRLNNNSKIILSNRRDEDKLRKINVEIPKFPDQGIVTFKGKQIGFADNFNGVSISDINFVKEYLLNMELSVLYSSK